MRRRSARVPRVLWRIIDANLNRAQEGVRTAEECVRFGAQDRALTQRLRRLRHAIGQAARRVPGGRAARLASRDVLRDVGRTARPRGTRDWTAVLDENLQRATEALRVLEECLRTLDLRSARIYQRLRFDVYELERLLYLRLATLRHSRRRRLRAPRRGGLRRLRH